jgi:hypothetical protein
MFEGGGVELNVGPGGPHGYVFVMVIFIGLVFPCAFGERPNSPPVNLTQLLQIGDEPPCWQHRTLRPTTVIPRAGGCGTTNRESGIGGSLSFVRQGGKRRSANNVKE